MISGRFIVVLPCRSGRSRRFGELYVREHQVGSGAESRVYVLTVLLGVLVAVN